MGLNNGVFQMVGAIIGGVMIGALCGMLSLIVGIMKKKAVLGVVGFAISVLFGVIMSTFLQQPAFLSIIPSAIIAGIIFLLTKKNQNH
ncbi:MAG: hypothetical protein E7624_02495 [Ruminococcaceae bacterium]|nr:hypothetical protein [Oscillospiraceae bacterium]